MADTLLITDQPRIAALFAKVHEGMTGRLRVVPTLSQGEEELSLAPPSHLFVQGIISGLGTTEVLRYLERRLPPETALVLLTADSDGLDSYGPDALDVSCGDAELKSAIAARLAAATSSPDVDVPYVEAAPSVAPQDLLFQAHHDDPPARAAGGWRWMLYASGIAAGVAAGAIWYHFAGS